VWPFLALKILDEVQQSYIYTQWIHSKKTAVTLEKLHILQGPQGALEESNQIDRLLPVSDWLDGLIGPPGLLLVVSHLFAVPVLVLSVGLEINK
jgi:hypothetical protein